MYLEANDASFIVKNLNIEKPTIGGQKAAASSPDTAQLAAVREDYRRAVEELYVR